MTAVLPSPHVGSPIDALNSACFCFSLDEDALARALDSELGQPGLSAAARHVAAAYHHFQAVAALDNCNHDQAQAHAATADAESAAAHKCSMTAGKHSHEEAVPAV